MSHQSVVSFKIASNELPVIVTKAKTWALMHALAMRSKAQFSFDSLEIAPFMLLPTPFPRKQFVEACDVQVIVHTLMHRVANDYAFLKETLQPTAEVDDFIRNLVFILDVVQLEGATQPISLTLIRTDLMLDCESPNPGVPDSIFLHLQMKQVEINTISAGFGWMGPVTTRLHEYVLAELGYDDVLRSIPDNTALEGLCTGMLQAWQIYNDADAVILFIVEDMTYNICDQRAHEYEIRRQNPRVKILRKTLTHLTTDSRLGPDKELLVDDLTVAVVYFRSGYEPRQYPTSAEWDVRLMIERSLAIKCPSIRYHLAGLKKIQQALAVPRTLERFLQDPGERARIEKLFAGLYSLEKDKGGAEAVHLALGDPDRFVMKPQREGGGNNLFGNDLRNFLLSDVSWAVKGSWIIMERLFPPVQKNYMIRPRSADSTELKDVVSELGIFGVIIADEKTIYFNQQCGHALRTKLAEANEGGVSSGAGACDSIYLVG